MPEGNDAEVTAAVDEPDLVEIVVPATVVEERQDDDSTYVIAESFVAPIPPPHYLAGYEAAVPGSGAEIIKMARDALRHEQRMDVVHAVRSFAGLMAGFVIAILFGWFAYRLGQQGHDWLAAALGGADLAGLVAIFVIGSRRTAGDDQQDGPAADGSGEGG